VRSFKSEIEARLCKALGIPKGNRKALYEIANMDRLVAMADANLSKLHEVYETTSRSTMATMVALAPVMKEQGHMLDASFDEFEKKFAAGAPLTDLGSVEGEM
jgi:hypothetical protein